MIRSKKTAIAVLAVILILSLSFAFGCSQEKQYYTVTFMDGQTQIGQPIQVEKGKKIPEYPDAARSDPNYVFDAWFKDEELTKIWNRDTERVTKDITLWANFLYVPATPSNVAMDGAAFSNTVTWLQRDITADTDFKVEILGTVIASAGKNEFAFENYKGHNDIFTVKWTPAQKPLGGLYSVKITSGDTEGVTADGLMFKGAGTSENPYLLTSQTDLTEISAQNVSGGYFKLAQSFTARLSADNAADKTFGGNLNGNGKTITLEASDCGLFGVLGVGAEVKDVTVAGAVSNVQTDCVGVIAGINRGKISYCTVSASLDSPVGTVGSLTGDKDGIEGGAAGIAGINYGEISCCTYSGTVKANVGGAGVAVINNGTVSLCSLTGTIGAANSVETGNSTKAYSYIGGIVAINYSVVEKSSTDGSGKILAQRGENGTNDNVGGIVAVNESGATVRECWFDGIRVHGNRNVGGVAGVNAGTITHCYAGGDYHSGSKNHSYVGGLCEVGGICGLSDGGSVTNCFVTSNVYAYSGNAYKVAQNAANSIYIGSNLDGRDGIVAVTANEENGNIRIELNGDYSAKNYALVLTGGQLSSLNGGASAFTDETNVRLACESETTVMEHLITVTVNGKVIGTLSSVSGNSISLKEYTPEEVPAGKYFAGWSVTQNGEAAFAESAQITYSALEKYGAEQITLYPVFIEGVKPQSRVLNVAVWTRYVEEDTAKALFEAFKSSPLFGEGYEVVYTVLTSSNNSNFKTDYEKGEYNVAFAYKAAAVDAWQTSIAEIYIYSVNDGAYATLKVGLNSPDDVVVNFGEFLKTDVAKKIMNPSYVSEAEADKIEITLMDGSAQFGEKLTVSNATEATAINLPAPEATAGKSFAGWAFTPDKQENETCLKGNISYDDVKESASGGKLTLYARYEEGEVELPDLVIAIHASASSSTYITDQEIDNLKSQFALYLSDNGYTGVNIDWHIVEGVNANGFTGDVTEYEAGVDVAVGGNNMDTSSPALTFSGTYGKVSAKTGLFANTSRKVGVLAGSENNKYAVLFYEFMTQS